MCLGLHVPPAATQPMSRPDNEGTAGPVRSFRHPFRKWFRGLHRHGHLFWWRCIRLRHRTGHRPFRPSARPPLRVSSPTVLALCTNPSRRTFPMHFLRSATMLVLFLKGLVARGNSCVFCHVYFLPLYFQFVKADSLILAGVRMLPYISPKSAIAILSGWFVGWTGYYTLRSIIAGAICITARLFSTPSTILRY